MRKTTQLTTIEEFARLYPQINFPEYQREPNVWSRAAKQRLIDSIMREFDIASIYLYVDDNGSIDCIDGRQRIGAIMSFIEENPLDSDNGFDYKISNEIKPDEAHPYESLDGMTLARIQELSDQSAEARCFVDSYCNYALTIVQLSGSRQPDEFNLQFTRLNLGTIINSGEKLHAMVGALRETCFSEEGIGKHDFFRRISIPTRRYSREQVAAQILVQILHLAKTKQYTRTRHFDLQRAFKEYQQFTPEDEAIIQETQKLVDLLNSAFDDLHVLRNRAITVSAVLLAWEERVSSAADANRLADFLKGFICRLQWQVKKGLDIDPEYRYLIDFQRHLTQASVEKPAVKARAKVLSEEFGRWREHHAYRGDAEFKVRTGKDPEDVCRQSA